MKEPCPCRDELLKQQQQASQPPFIAGLQTLGAGTGGAILVAPGYPMMPPPPAQTAAEAMACACAPKPCLAEHPSQCPPPQPCDCAPSTLNTMTVINAASTLPSPQLPVAPVAPTTAAAAAAVTTGASVASAPAGPATTTTTTTAPRAPFNVTHAVRDQEIDETIPVAVEDDSAALMAASGLYPTKTAFSKRNSSGVLTIVKHPSDLPPEPIAPAPVLPPVRLNLTLKPKAPVKPPVYELSPAEKRMQSTAQATAADVRSQVLDARKHIDELNKELKVGLRACVCVCSVCVCMCDCIVTAAYVADCCSRMFWCVPSLTYTDHMPMMACYDRS